MIYVQWANPWNRSFKILSQKEIKNQSDPIAIQINWNYSLKSFTNVAVGSESFTDELYKIFREEKNSNLMQISLETKKKINLSQFIREANITLTMQELNEKRIY